MKSKLFRIILLMLTAFGLGTTVLKFELCVAVKPRNCIIELPICMPCTYEMLLLCTHNVHPPNGSLCDVKSYINTFHMFNYDAVNMLGFWMTELFLVSDSVAVPSTNCTWTLRKYASLRMRMLKLIQWIMCVDKINGFCFWLNDRKREHNTFKCDSILSKHNIPSVGRSYCTERIFA